MKISFPSVDLDVSLPEIEYEYLKFICHQTLQTSDEVLRSQLRQLQLPGLPDFNTWRSEHSQQPQLALPEATTTVDVRLASAEIEAEQSPTTEPVGEEAAEPIASLEPTVSAKRSNRRRTAEPKEFDPKKLRSDFKGRSVQDSVVLVLEQEPDRSFSADDLIVQVYGQFTGEELVKARRSVGRMLGEGVKRKMWARSQEKPPLYQATGEPIVKAESDEIEVDP